MIPQLKTKAGYPEGVCKTSLDGDVMESMLGTDIDDYTAYLDRLKQEGFTCYQEREVCGNYYGIYIKENICVRTSFIPYLSRIRILWGSKKFLPPLEKPKYEKICPITVCQPGRKGTSNMAPGMSYVLTLADGTFIVIDGGPYHPEDEQWLLDYLKTNNKKEGKPQVIWMFSHIHGDHTDLALHFWEHYGQEIDLKMAIYHYPDYAVSPLWRECGNAPAGIAPWAVEHQTRTERLLSEKWSNVIQYTYHTGDILHLAGMDIEFLYSPVDFYPQKRDWGNQDSGAWMMRAEGHKLLILGDCERTLCQHMVDAFGDYLKTDMMQPSHHGFNCATDSIYFCANPKINFWAVDEERYNTDPRCRGEPKDYFFNKYLRLFGERQNYPASETVTFRFDTLEKI